MPFPNKGENHAVGIKNEKDIVDYLNNNPDNNITKFMCEYYSSDIISFKHEGGTKQKRDSSCILENETIRGQSIKRHSTGTFDWINTTKDIPTDLISDIKIFQQQNMETIIPKKGGIRDELANIFSTHLNKLASDNIHELLIKIYKS